MANSRASGRHLHGLSVPILVDDGAEYRLNVKAIHQIFCSSTVAERPVAVIAMSGAMHCGKSLMLNYFYEHLNQSKVTRPPFRNSDVPKRCFDWGNGMNSQPKTRGIYITRQPVIIRKENEEIAVFLMDTEGFNPKSPQAQLIFTLSTLLSSVQIINVQNDIKDRDVLPLKMFTSAFDELRKYTPDKVFQTKLLFLVRDCGNTLKYKFGEEDGAAFLEHCFQTGLKREIRGKLRKLFQQIDCFLLPHPGSKATVRQIHAFTGSLRAMNDSFVSELDHLLSRALSLDNIVVKRAGTESLKGSTYKEYIETCFNALLTAHTMYQPVIFDCLRIFKEELTQEFSLVALDEEEFSQLCAEKEEEAFERFHSTVGDVSGQNAKENLEKYLSSLQQELAANTDQLHWENKRSFETFKHQNEQVAKNALAAYQKRLDQYTQNQEVDGQMLSDIHDTALAIALRRFDSSRNRGGNVFVSKFRNKLKEQIMEAFQQKREEICEQELGDCASMEKRFPIKMQGGRLDHEVCSLDFPKGATAGEVEIEIRIAKDDSDWPSNEYLRKSPVIEFQPTNRKFRKPVMCQIPCWYLSYSPGAQARDKVYVMQKKNGTWCEILSEALETRTHIECNITQLSPIALAVENPAKPHRVSSMLFLDRSGNFIARFFDRNDMNDVKETAKRERYATASDMNTFDVNPADEITVTLSAPEHDLDPTTQRLSGEDVYAQNTTRSLHFAPCIQPADGMATMQYEVKVNDVVKISHPCRVNLNNPGRPDTRHGAMTFNRTEAVGGYLTINTSMDSS